MERNLCSASVPAGISVACMDMICQITHSGRERKEYQCGVAQAAAGTRDSLEYFSILFGYHHVQWAGVITRTYKKQVPRPEADLKNKNEKSPHQTCWRF